MESAKETIWYVAAYAQCVGVIALLGGLLVAIVYQMARDQLRESSISTSMAGSEPTAPSTTANP